MTKYYFFYNKTTFNSILMQKISLNLLPLKFLVRNYIFKSKELFVIDTFSLFFTTKIKKNLKKKKNVDLISAANTKQLKFAKLNKAKKISNTIQVGSFIDFERRKFTGKKNFNLIFFFFKPQLYLKKKKYLNFLLNTLNFFKFITNNIIIIRKKKLKKGLLKFFLNGLFLVSKKKSINIKKYSKQKKFLIKLPLAKNNNDSFIIKPSLKFNLYTNQIQFLKYIDSNISLHLVRPTLLTFFTKQKKIYKKDFRLLLRYSIKYKRLRKFRKRFNLYKIRKKKNLYTKKKVIALKKK